jgi:hypothetical protein
MLIRPDDRPQCTDATLGLLPPKRAAPAGTHAAPRVAEPFKHRSTFACPPVGFYRKGSARSPSNTWSRSAADASSRRAPPRRPRWP